mgnify:CR=1 FL=1
MKQIKYNVNKLKDFDTEWLLHKKCSEWWYATSILRDKHNNLYSCQYTFLRMRLLPFLKPYILMSAVTDFQTKKHYYAQKFTLSKKNITIDIDKVTGADSSILKNKNGMIIESVGDKFSYKLNLEYGKGAYWHCNNGKLYMGIEDEKQTTLYYSYTNMPTTGIINLNGKEIEVHGSTWFDKQGGNFNFMNTHTHWEWFSMRFYDNEEIMLFNFPQQNYCDGTYIKNNLTSSRLNNYTMKPIKFTEKNGYKFSCGWELKMPKIKDENYKIIPIIDGQMNIAYFEQLCYIYDKDNKEVGMCFVELLPGVYNKKLDAKLLLKNI